MGKKYIYKENDIINNLKILNCTRVKHGKGTEKGYNYQCCDCGYKASTSEIKLKNGQQCPVCKGTHKKCVKEINSIWKTNPELRKYFNNIEDSYNNTYSSCNKALMKCPICNSIKEMIIGNLTYQGFACNKCGDGQSYPNKLMFNILEQLLDINNFDNEYNPEWIKPRKYDFYFEINNKKYIVEMDGGLGHGNSDNLMNGQTKEESQAIDDYKDRLADEHGITVIRIDCKYGHNDRLNYIKNNIIEKLSNIFNLSKIDWKLAEEFALSSRVKEACELKRENPDMTTTQIGKIMKLERSTIQKYLKKGSKIWGWCDYNPKEEKIKSAIKCGKKNGKAILCYKDNVFLGEFSSASDLQNKSKEIFGTKLYQNAIRNCCIDENKIHKGYTFKYKKEVFQDETL